MAGTVLGKRTRGIASPAAAPGVSTRVKRRVVLNAPNDENENPFTDTRHHGDQHKDKDEDEDEDEDAEADWPPRKRRAPVTTARSVPAKHGAPEQRISVSPSKPPSRVRLAKSASIGVYEDAADENASPATPTHRAAARANKLPITPRHRVLVASARGSPRTPTSSTKGTPATARSSLSVYHQARALFSRCSGTNTLVGREEERTAVATFIDDAMESSAAGCLYVSGPPGTGKSAFVEQVSQTYAGRDNLRQSVINCMGVRSAKDLGCKLAEDLGVEEKGAGEKTMRSCFISTGKATKYLVILDEVDRLVDLDLALLYNLFEWALHPSSRLILIGIANALDLTDRFLPRLKRRNLQPTLLPFLPYSAAQIATIITTKLHTLVPSSEQPHNGPPPFLHPAAIQFCAKKVAGQTGDLRKAFDICRRAIDLVERETRAQTNVINSPSKTPLMENINLSSSPSSSSSSPPATPLPQVYTPLSAPKATIAHMATVTAQVFSHQGATQRLAGLNLQQRVVLASLVASENDHHRPATFPPTTPSSSSTSSAASAPTIKGLYTTYSNLCTTSSSLHPLTASEFRDVVAGLESLGLVLPVDLSSSFTSSRGSKRTRGFPPTPSKTPTKTSKTKTSGFGNSAAGILVDGGEKIGLACAVSAGEFSKVVEEKWEGVAGELVRGILRGGERP